MILSVCTNPEILQVTKYVKLVIDIIRIVVPIALIITIMASILEVVGGKVDDELSHVLKSSVNKILAAILIFLVPTFVNIIFETLDAKSIDFASCLNNATAEKIDAAYVIRAQNYVETANETLLRGDYNIAKGMVTNLKNESEKASLNEQLDVIEKKIAEREEEEKKKNSVVMGGEFTYPLGSYTSVFTACFAGNDAVHQALGGGHGAVDLGAPGGTPVYASKGGKVTTATNNVDGSTYSWGCNTSSSCGNYVNIDHLDGTSSRYCHMTKDTILVKVGDMVSQGQEIGKVGTTGCSTGDHLHFAVYSNGVAVNPVDYVQFNVSNPGGCG